MNVKLMSNCFKKIKNVSLFTLMLMLSLALVACGNKNAAVSGSASTKEEAVYVDYASSIKLDMNSSTKKEVVTVKTYVDGDTTHFNVPTTIMEDGVLKARYLAINTPESTGKIEEWGKAASKFTRETLSKATSIVIESDDSNWNIDSTGGRILVWVWYRTSENEEYRNLNIELLQNGLAIASSAANNRYGSTATAAIANAKALRLNIYSGEKDPDFFYGDAVELTLKELRTNVSKYAGMKVAFNGVITRNGNNTAYVEDYDDDTDMYYGMTVYYGFGLNGEGLDILTVGNYSRIVGTVQYYEAGDSYQISGLTYRQMKPNDPSNIQKLADGYSASYREITPDQLANGKKTITVEDSEQTFDFGALAIDTTVSIKNLTVESIYTTDKKDSSSNGAMTITCKGEDGVTITIRTDVLYDDNKNLVTEDAYLGKNIDVKGLIGAYGGKYQVRVLSAKDITINN